MSGLDVFPPQPKIDVATHHRQRIRKCRFFLHIPGRSAYRERFILSQAVRKQGDQGKQAQQSGDSTRNRQVRPLALGFQAQVSACFLKSNFDIPTQNKPMQDLEGAGIQVGAEKSSGPIPQLGLSLSRIRTVVNPQLDKSLSYPSYRYFVRQDTELLELWQAQREK
jgi:hypothetical protein